MCAVTESQAEVGRSGVQGQPGLHKTPPQRTFTDLPVFSSSWTTLGREGLSVMYKVTEKYDGGRKRGTTLGEEFL